MKTMIFLKYFIGLLFVLTVSCSEDNSKTDDEEEDPSATTSYAPKEVKDKVFKVSGHFFAVKFTSNSSGIVSENMPGTIYSEVVGTSSCVYKRLSEDRASIQLTYQSKMTIGSDYTLDTNTYDFDLTFTQSGAGNAQGPYKYVIKAVVNGKTTSTTKSGNISRPFTLN